MSEHEVDRELAERLQGHFALDQEQEDLLWARFAARREALQWQAFAAALALANASMRSVRRAATWFTGERTRG